MRGAHVESATAVTRKKPRARSKTKSPAAPRRSKKARAKFTDRQLARVSAKALETVTANDPDKTKIRPVHWRFLRAKLDCLDAGQPLTAVNHAKHAGVSRIALWKLQQKYPWLEEWCNEVMKVANAHRWGSIEHRMAHLGEQGHVAAADQYCKMQSGHYTRSSALNGDGGAGALAGVTVTNNFLVPRPDYAGALAAQSVPALPAAPATAKIPEVRVR